jgi:hypothetical protein
MMFHIHRWGKWEKPFSRKYTSVDSWTGKVIRTGEGVEYWQKRICKKCGKEEWRQVD